MAKIGWIGLGQMGIPMVENLLKGSVDVTVYNRSFDKTLPLVEKGAKNAKTVPLIEDTTRSYSEALEEGYGEQDMSAIFEILSKKNN